MADGPAAESDDEASTSARPAGSAEVVFVGALPPPLTGMTAITQVVVDAIETRTPVHKFNWSRGKPLKGMRWKAARFWGAFKSLFGLAWRGPAHGAKIYYAVSAGSGLYCDLAIAAMGRLLGYRLVFHHHVYTYITRRDWRVAWLDRLTGRAGAHVVYCDMMRDDFLRQYDSQAHFLIVPPTIVAQQMEHVDTPPRQHFTIGFLSNLTFAKGVQDAIGTFDRLASQGRPVRLLLAGPCLEDEVQGVIDDAVKKWPGRIEYRGAVYGRDKANFYASLDAFMFPTRHRHESWGIVLNEALTSGAPVIARCPGCVKWIVQDGCGVVVEPEQDFVDVAASLIARWIDDPQLHAAARTAARQRADVLDAQAKRELPQFVEDLLALGDSNHRTESTPLAATIPGDRCSIDRAASAVAPALSAGPQAPGDIKAVAADEPQSAQVTFVGALPPPVTGMTAMTAVIVDELARHTRVRRFNWSRGKPLSGWRWKVARGWGAFKSFFRLIAGGRAPGSTLYYPVSRRGGMYYDIMIASLARLLKYRLVLHHHSYTYIDRYDWRAALLDRLANAHAVHCELMKQDFLRKYNSTTEFLYVPPTIVSQQLETLPTPQRNTFNLGFLSFLMMDKGLDEVIVTFERLAEQGRNVRLILAGPCKGAKERHLIEATVAKWPGRVDYRGPVYGRDKAQFFADIDAFLFPTRYAAESWGIVLTEALAAGRPVAARSRACVRWIVNEDCGVVVDPQADYVAAAVALISTWIDSPATYQRACDAARRRSDQLQDDAERQFPEFVRRLADGRIESQGAERLRSCPSPIAGAAAEPSRA